MPAKKKPLRGRPTPAELERRKARVLDIAKTLFMKHGYAGTSVARIAQTARVSPRMITAHFGDKASIFTQVITERNARYSLAVTEVAADSNSLEDILFGVAKYAWSTSYSPEALAFTRLIVGEGERFFEQTSAIARISSESYRGSMTEIFRELHSRGLFTRDDPKRSAKYFIDLIVGTSAPQAAMGYTELVPTDDEIRLKIRIFIAGWLNAPDAARSPA
jgi:AcrR family transcriptional regulator